MQPDDPDPRDRKRFYFHATPIRRLGVGMLRLIFRFIMHSRVEGLRYLPGHGAVIVAANHVTTLDVFPMQLSLPRPIFFMGKAELFRIPVFEALFRNLGAFPVYRGERDRWAMRHAAEVLAHGETLGMFPEGTRSQGTGLTVAKTGAARLAIEAHCPIVPMAVVGSDKFFRSFPHRARVTIKLLPPILPRPGESALSLTDRYMFALAAALPEEMRGVYAEVPVGFRT
jgi:1-acyl-sn-glycerol-3-phosphate acyltransferase